MDKTKIIEYWKKNKIVITIIIFGVYAAFFSDYNVFKRTKLNREIKALEEQKAMYSEKIKQDSIKLYQLRTNDKTFERFARENYYFHAPNEDIFIIEETK